jgi:ankyrin repeat protein
MRCRRALPPALIALMPLMALLLGTAAGSACAQGGAAMPAAELVVTVAGRIEQTPTLGAGIVFAREKDRLHIVTANHVVRSGGREAGDLQIRLKGAPGVVLKARLLPQVDAGFDLAVLVVDDVTGVAPCSLALNVLAAPEAIARGRDVYPVGNPNGEPWALPVKPDAIAEVRNDRVVFQSAVLARGHSGGALIDASGLLVGLIQADEPPFGRALEVRKLVELLAQWKLPVQLRVPDSQGLPPLFSAARRGDEQGVRQLLAESCTDVNATLASAGGLSAMHLAARESANVTQLLLDAGARVDTQDRSGQTPLYHAAQVGAARTVQLLLARGASAAAKGALSAATERGAVEIVKLLLAAGADPNSALMMTVTAHASGSRAAREQILRLLIDAGAAVNTRDKDGDTALTLAVENGYTESVRALLEAGAIVQVKNRNKDSPLRLLTHSNSSAGREIALLLLERPTAVEADDAARLLGRLDRDWADVVRLLARRGLDARSPAAQKALVEAAERGHADVLGALLDAGVDPNPGGRPTPLQNVLGAQSREAPDAATRLAIVKLLLAKGSRVSLSAGPTQLLYQEPLYLALIKLDPPDIEVAKLLIARGANVNAAYPDGMSLLSVAESLKSQEAAALLRKHGARRR